MKINFFIVFCFAILVLVSANQSNERVENKVADEFSLDIQEILNQMNSFAKFIEECFKNFNIFESISKQDCKIQFANLIVEIPNITKTMNVITKRFISENHSKDL